MASDLEKFLQQAAERLAQKLNEGNKPQPARPRSPAASTAPRSVRSTERQRPALQAEIIDSDEDLPHQFENRRELGPDPLSNIDTRPGLAQKISQTDERLAGRLHDVFDHEVTQLRQASAALNPNPTAKGETEKSIDLQRRHQAVSPLVKMLRQPETLRAAFIASEIFKRKF